MPFIHFTVAVEYDGSEPGAKMTNRQLSDCLHDLVSYANTVVLPTHIKAKTVMIEPATMPDNGKHIHDNDGSCTTCYALYQHMHENNL
jgi:hypothetical protein